MIILDRSSAVPLYQQLYDQIVTAIVRGEVPAGHRLLPMRKRAAELGVSRNTVEQAYRMLTSEGYVSPLQGSGFIVNPLQNRHPAHDEMSEEYRNGQEALAAIYARHHAHPLCRYDFNYGNLDPTTFPTALWGRLSRDVLYGDMAEGACRYDELQGLAELRREIIRYLSSESGVHAIPEQVVIASGTQNALESILRAFDPAKDRVMMENPGFPIARIAFKQSGFDVIPLQVEKPWREFGGKPAGGWPRLMFVTPSAQFPTNSIMPLEARKQLLDWADAHDAYIIEDDYCREFRYGEAPLPSMQSLDTTGRVIYLGTFSKTLNPSLRVSYIVFPPRLMLKWCEANAGLFPQVAWQIQATIADYMRQGHWDKHLALMRATSARKRTLLLAALDRTMGDKVTIGCSQAGLHVLVSPKDERDEAALIEAAADADVRVYPTSHYWMPRVKRDNRRARILIGYSAIAVNDIEPGIEALAQAWFPRV